MDILCSQELNEINGGSKTLLLTIGGILTGFIVLGIGIFCGIFEK